jgi:hypothetical protein
MKLTRAALKQLVREQLETLQEVFATPETDTQPTAATQPATTPTAPTQSATGETAQQAKLAKAAERAMGPIIMTMKKPMVEKALGLLGAALAKSGKPGTELRANAMALVVGALGAQPDDFTKLRMKGSEKGTKPGA